MKWPLRNKPPALPSIGAVGDFAFRRSFYHHPGVDIYCDKYQEVQAIEDGVIVNIENFTGPNANPPSPWWLETWSILIEGTSGVLGYCEMMPNYDMHIGQTITEGQILGIIVPVLKRDKGNGTTMLHFEHYEHGTKDHVTWVLDTPKPNKLLNSRFLLEKLISQ